MMMKIGESSENIRNIVTQKVKKDKKNYFKKLYDKADNCRDTKALFRITSEQLGWKQDAAPTALVEDGTFVTKPREMAELLSKYFDEKIQTLKNSIPNTNSDPTKQLKMAMNKWQGAENRVEFQLREVTLLEVSTILGELRKLNNNGTR